MLVNHVSPANYEFISEGGTCNRGSPKILEALSAWQVFYTHHRSCLMESVQGKIKNDEIKRWRIELARYNFDTIYRSGTKNVAAASFTRMLSSTITFDELMRLHISICHPGVTIMTHFLKTKIYQ